MKLYSWNVNGLRAVLNKGALQHFLATEHPDVLCLQEIKAKPTQIDYDFAKAGYQVFYNSAKRPGYSGTAVLIANGCHSLLKNASSRGSGAWQGARPLGRASAARDERRSPVALAPWDANCRRQTGRPDAPREGAFLTNDISKVTVSDEGRIMVLEFEQFYLVNVYTPNSKPDLSRLGLRYRDWDPAFLQMLKDLEKTKPVVTCGDFNAAHTEIDLARPKTNHKNAGFTDEERQGVTNLIAAGFLDTFRTLYPETQRYTWWSHWGHAREHNVGWRIDYFFVSQSLKPHLKSAEIYEHYLGSDHCPISITLEF